MNQESEKQPLAKIVQDLKKYVEKRVEIITLEYQQKAAGLLSAVLSDGIGIALLLVGILFLLISSAIGLGYLFNNMMLGFLTLSLLLMIPGSIIYRYKRNKLKLKMKQNISDFIDRNILDNK